MWVLTTSGFLSIVEEPSGEHAGELVVRARERGALEALCAYAPGLSEVEVYADSDYRYRAWAPREEVADALAAMVRAVRYTNFKSEVYKKQGPSRYEQALHSIWWRLGRLQPRGPYGTGGPGYPRVPKGERARSRGGRQRRLV